MNTTHIIESTHPSGRRVRAACVLVLAAAVIGAWPTSAAQSSSPVSPFGTQVRLTLAQQSVRGELLAVSNDSVWILNDAFTVALARSDVRRVSYRRHNFGGRRALISGGVVSVVTTLAMAAACNSYTSTSEGAGTMCGNAVGAWFAVTAGLTLLTSGWSWARQWHDLPLTRWEQLSAHARFPQGLPPTFRKPPPP